MSSDSSPIELRIRGINGGQQTLTVRTTSKFNKIKVIYCATVGLVPSQLRLLYDGIPIPDYPTPKMLEIKGGDIVETERSDQPLVQSRPPLQTVSSDSDHINIVIRATDGNKKSFTVKKTAKFGKLMVTYWAQAGLDKAHFRLLFDGKHIADDETPETLEMEDGDIVEACLQQEGGGSIPVTHEVEVATARAPITTGPYAPTSPAPTAKQAQSLPLAELYPVVETGEMAIGDAPAVNDNLGATRQALSQAALLFSRHAM